MCAKYGNVHFPWLPTPMDFLQFFFLLFIHTYLWTRTLTFCLLEGIQGSGNHRLESQKVIYSFNYPTDFLEFWQRTRFQQELCGCIVENCEFRRSKMTAKAILEFKNVFNFWTTQSIFIIFDGNEAYVRLFCSIWWRIWPCFSLLFSKKLQISQ